LVSPVCIVEPIQDLFLLALRRHAAREAARDYSPIQERPKFSPMEPQIANIVEDSTQ
jgi:hypothetical protein